MVDDLKPRYTTKRLRQEIERARENDARHIAALEAQLAERVKVKQLEWVELNEGKAFRALLPVIGSIRIEPYGVCGWWEVLWSMPGQCDKLIPDVFDTPDEAKAAAQADYERRILSALESTPPATHANSASVEATQPAPKVMEEEWREIEQVAQPRIRDGYTAVKISRPGFWFVKGPGPAAAQEAGKP